MTGSMLAALAGVVALSAQAMSAAGGAVPAAPVAEGETLAAACRAIPPEDTCALLAEAARMLGPSYAADKARGGVAAFRALGYDAQYYLARAGRLQGTTDVFLVSRPRSNRLFVVITGTESTRDWLENAKIGKYTAAYRDGQFYVPPGHAGFRRGMLNIVNSGLLRLREFDDAPLDCARAPANASKLARYLCAHQVASGSGAVETVIVGHSRGAGIGLLMATVLAGLEIRVAKGAPASVAPQTHWPLSLRAVIGFAPPYAVYARSDAELGMPPPAGIDDQWTLLQRYRIPERTFLFLNERDLVPGLSLGEGRHFGHRFRIRGTGAVFYDGMDWGPDASAIDAHRNGGYCRAVLRALGEAERCGDGGSAPAE